MQLTRAIQVKARILTPLQAATMQNVAGQLVSSSRKTHTIDAKHFAQEYIAALPLSSSSPQPQEPGCQEQTHTTSLVEPL